MTRRFILAATGVLLSALPALAQMGQQGPPAVTVMAANLRPVTESTEFVGRIESVERVDVRARVTGTIEQRPFREGSEVKRGDVLFRLDRAPFEADLAGRKASIASADAELANARVNLSRAQELVRTNAGTRVSLDNATAQERTAAAQLLGAQAAVRTSEINLGYTEITSPIDGKIGRTNFTIGNIVGPDSGTLATIVSVDPMRVSFPISMRQATELRDRYGERGGVNAVRVRVRLSSGTLYPHPGRIEFIDNQVDRNTDTILVRALLPNPVRPGAEGDRELIDGQFVNAVVEGNQPVQAIVLPRAAVLQDQQGAYVFALDDQNRAQRRNIRLGRSLGGDVVVEGGLDPGMRVVTEGIQRVRPGQPVNPSEAPAAAPAGSPPAARPVSAPAAAPASGTSTPGTQAPQGARPPGGAPAPAPSSSSPSGGRG